MVSAEIIRANLKNCLTGARFPELPNFYAGKVRENYDLADQRRLLISTDRQSAFDQILTAVPFKGQVLNETAKFWFEKTRSICPNHALEFPDPNVTLARKLKMLPLEVVVRDYLTGSSATSVWPAYAKGAREFCGNSLPEGLRKNQKLPTTILTPSTKPMDGSHDESVAPQVLIEQKLISASLWEELAEIALKLFAFGRAAVAKNGLILVDTKFEFGLSEEGKITLADEIFTPDSSRFWRQASYAERFANKQEPECLDKEFLRLWITQRCDPYKEKIPAIPAEVLVEFSQKYLSLFEAVTGQDFVLPDLTQPPLVRLRRNLEQYFSA